MHRKSNSPFLSVKRPRVLAFSVAGLMVLLAAAPLPFTLASPACAPGVGVGSCEVSGDSLGGVYFYDSITVPAGSTLSATLAIVLHARQTLDIEGTVVAPAITLISDQTATVNGLARTPDGDSVNPNAGSIHVVATLLNLGGALQTGNGAPGIDQTMDEGVSVPAVVATGTPGGRGGDIIISAPSMILSGHIVLGNGGNGGSAIALGGTQTALAKGGVGGSSGVLITPPTFDPITLYNEGILLGGVGGNGGDGIAAAPGIGPDGTPGHTTVNDDNANWNAYCAGAPGTQPGERGSDGCPAPPDTAQGGDGGTGIVRGGNGGSASTYGGYGGHGGNGGSGFDQCQPTCGPGGPGGAGGHGGDATAQGGNGGIGALYGGNGGSSIAAGGSGGHGGDGGDAGWTVVSSCVNTNVAYCGTSSTIQCYVPGAAGAGGAKAAKVTATQSSGGFGLQPGAVGYTRAWDYGTAGPGQNGVYDTVHCGPPPGYLG